MWLYTLLCLLIHLLISLFPFNLFFLGLWPHCSYTNALMTSNMAPAYSHATGVAVYLANWLFFFTWRQVECPGTNIFLLWYLLIQSTNTRFFCRGHAVFTLLLLLNCPWLDCLVLALFLGHLINASNLMLLLGDLIYFKIAIIIDAGGIWYSICFSNNPVILGS